MEKLVKQPLLNTYVNNVSMDETIDVIGKLIEKKKKSYIVAINVDVVMKIENDSLLKKIADDADLTLVDGQALVWIANWMHHPVKEKVSGSDLVPKVCAVAAKEGWSIFIIGGKEGIASKAADNLRKTNPGMKVVGTYSPPFGFEKDEAELDRINEMINVAHPDILIACFGCPKQEKWIYQNYQKYDATVSICAGATVDFLAGNVERAPKWMSDHGLEWFYRFTREPNRLFKRYFVDDVKILKLIRKYK